MSLQHNEKVFEALLRSQRAGSLPHALLLSGPALEAKLGCVERFAAVLFAEGGEGGLFGTSPADSGRILERIRSRNHPDFTRIEAPADPDDKRAPSLLEQVRELPRLLSFPPLEARRRIVLIPDAAALNEKAFNSALKILEEPPAHTMFFLLCRDPGELLQTIRSRCQVFRFAPLTDEELSARFGPLDEPSLAPLLGFSEGAPERAGRLLQNEPALQLRSEACAKLLELWEAAPRIPSGAALWVEKLEDEQELLLVLECWELLLRDLCFTAAGAAPAQLRFGEFHPRLAELARRAGADAFHAAGRGVDSLDRFRVHRLLNGNLRLNLSALLGELQIFSVGMSSRPAVN